MQDVMVDLETLGSVAGCSILSIGAVAFNTREVEERRAFDMTIDRASCAEVGLHECPETIAWWGKQSQEAREILAMAEDPGTARHLARVLTEFNFWLRRFGPNVRVWGNGADFDNAVLAAAYRAVGMKPYWRFWNGRCYRTLKTLNPSIKLERTGLHHRALDDAISQARHAVLLLSQLAV